MRRSFGGGGGRGSARGGGMLRTVQRAIRPGGGGPPPDPSSPSGIASANSRKAKHLNEKLVSTPNTALTLSSSTSGGPNNDDNHAPSTFSSLVNLPVYADSGPAWGSCSSPTRSDDLEWECLDGSEDFVFGTVPSRDEVNHAVSSLQQVLGSSYFEHFPKEKLSEDIEKDVDNEDSRTKGFEGMISSSESEVDWFEPSLSVYNSRMLQRPCGSSRVYDAFHLLQTEPSVQRMVLSLSSDRAVWDAVLNNDAVKELRGSICRADEEDDNREKESDDSNPVKDVLSWVFVNAKANIIQLIDKITKIFNGVYHPSNEEKKGNIVDPFEEKLKSSLFISIIVLLIVVVTRAQSA
ncbi:uncharacterized protein LOC105160622 [Sesamum indicum]|uniref:Uncharacterized protein LOC105160622 n=1 Tax=Sesamum indicum TaxID=4182 RepID=A0A6I9T0Q2_SESIN|nr:uncharacterized protein LOC105160622 [Sesamum indicum]